MTIYISFNYIVVNYIDKCDVVSDLSLTSKS